MRRAVLARLRTSGSHRASLRGSPLSPGIHPFGAHHLPQSLADDVGVMHWQRRGRVR